MSNRTPQYRRHRQHYARVKINGAWVHLGRYDDPRAKAKYKQLIAQWALGAAPEPTQEEAGLSVAELLVGYLDHAEAYYRNDPNHVGYVKRLIRLVRELYADLPARDFGPKKLKVVRDAVIARGWVRKKVNAAVRDIVAMFSWAAEQEMIEGSQVHALREVRSLRLGHCELPEGRRVRPVEQATIDATLPHMTRVLADMVQLQLFTGMRPGELCIMTPEAIDRSAPVWMYRPEHHKTEHHGHDRAIAIGPKAQDVLRKYLLRPADAPCFSPREALAQHFERQHERRTTPIGYGNKPNPTRRKHALAKVGTQYDVAAYRKAVERACDRAFPAPEGTAGKDLLQWRHAHRWTPHRLRHTAGTLARERFGLDACQALLGHRHARVSEIYGELQTAKAVEVARQLG